MYWKKLIHTHNPVLGDVSLKWNPVIQVFQRWLSVCVLMTVDLRWRGGMKTRPMQPEKTGLQKARIRTIGFPYVHYPLECRIQTTKLLHIHPHFSGHPPIQPRGQWESATEKEKKKQPWHNYKYKVLCRLPSTENMQKKKFPHLQNKNRQMDWHLLASPLWVRQASSRRSEDMPPFILINFKKAKIHFHIFLRTEFFFCISFYINP